MLVVALAALLVALIFALLSIRKKNAELMEELSSADSSINSLNEVNKELTLKNISLARYQKCIDAEAEADKIIKRAEDKANDIIQSVAKAKADADGIILLAKNEASNIKSEARGKAAENVQKSEEVLSQAIQKSNDIIVEAESKAREIAGEAYDMAKNVEFYEKALVSIKNTIKGYGFEYIKPTDSLLDGLAEDYSFTEAGKQLTQARALTKQMVSNNMAATCDYVEENRRSTAIAFVLDAFNGKVDSILALIKKDNYGTLEQKIRDAYSMVNLLGRPFRDARILEGYLDARLSELKWGAVVIALRERDREEQRAIKERIREEERARREYEKAIRDAEKQEAAIRKAIEKATDQLAKANQEQRQRFETQIVQLQQQLTEAEARNQRALSMAQQTRSGHVYIISNIGSFGENVYKIGMTRRLEPLDRVRELGDASVPFPFDVHAMIYSDDAPALETELHKLYAKHQLNKVNPRKEFFKVSLSEVRSYLEKKGVQTQWTLMAEAAQYRETIALEEAFRKDASSERQWIARQDKQIVENTDDFEED